MALNLEPIYQDIFSKLKTRKKFVIRSIEKNLLTVDQDEEICGQKEPKTFEFKSPKELHIVDALPRNPSGKVLKRILRDQLVSKNN